MRKKLTTWRSFYDASLVFVVVLHVSYSLHAMNYSVQLGRSIVTIKTQQNGTGRTFVHLHQNETTALKAAQAVVREEGGVVLTLVHPGQRNIVFYLHHKRYEFDPNRIFTDAGIKKTLRQFGNYSPEAHREVLKLSNQIKRLLPKGKVIAVHNNETYSLHDYLPGHALAHDAKLLGFTQRNAYRNFYLVTRRNDYLRLKKSHFNRVLQAKQAKDDGSLSIFLAKHRYINVEAGYHQFAVQKAMLKSA